jgi:hypothetical protein
MAIADDQVEFFETFGFLMFRQLFTESEMAILAREGKRIWAIEKKSEKSNWADHDHSDEIAERSRSVTELLMDGRIFGGAERLMGPDLIWGGSEFFETRHGEHGWHSDRPGAKEPDFPRLKIMIYLDRVSRDTGCLRVIPGSHRQPMHDALNAHKLDLFGIPGVEFPCHPLETNPGDVIFFHHCLYHGAFGGGPGRRYVAFKFCSRPVNDDQLTSIQRLSAPVFSPHENFTSSDDPRIRRMIDPIAELRFRMESLA